MDTHSFEYDKEKQIRKEALPMTKQKKLRHAEYYDMQSILDELYAESKDNNIFTNLMEIITDENNIKMAYRINYHSGICMPFLYRQFFKKHFQSLLPFVQLKSQLYLFQARYYSLRYFPRLSAHFPHVPFYLPEPSSSNL